MKSLKIIGISDTHNRHNKLTIPDGDIIIHAGDVAMAGHEREVLNFLEWYGKLNIKYKLFVPGNHDWACELNPELIQSECDRLGIHLLNDSGITLEGINFYGSAWTPWFYSWAFNARRTEEEYKAFGGSWMKHHTDLIPLNTNVLVTHGPMYGVLDELVFVDGTPKGEFVGCEELKTKIKELKELDLHFFGHIHAHGGTQKHIDGVSHYNCSICDETYYPGNPITIVDYIKE